ncbi:rho family-interacting cell polarization regulator 1-like [Portunus trituberculatus]|uniref:rho family-interacting cell polarization regulator 1-like n=1 Tax=Portunus trituberculatus TaxID=210409 RepID=UPI001E1CDB3A|nr:rho family-interacting cell polarization regulator 1-like [Portunus trituberculatus]
MANRGVKMRGPVLAAVTVLPLLLLLAVTQGVVVGPEPPTHAPVSNNVNCSESLKLLPVLRLVTPASTTTASTASQPLTSDTLALPVPTTTTHTLYSQPHGTPASITTPASPTTAPSKPTLRPKQYTSFNGKLKATKAPQTKHHPEKHDTHTLDKTVNKLKLEPYFAEIFSSSSSSSSSTSTPAPSAHITIPLPDSPPRTSTSPPPSPTLPLPTIPPAASATTPMSLHTLQQLGERMRQLVAKRLPLAITAGWAKEFQRPYLERIRAVNHEIVDKVLQVNYEEHDENSTTFDTNSTNTNACYLPEKRLAPLFHQQTLLLLLLKTLPQSLEEVEEATWNPEITDYIFRPEKRAVFDVYSCRQCYAFDASGVCREVFFCKNGEDMFSSRRRNYG